MIKLVWDLRVINVLAKFENDPWKIMDVRVLTGLVCPAARPLGVRQYPGALKRCGVKTDFFCREMGLESEIHISITQCFISTFLLKFDGGTPQNIHFNVFVIVMHSIHRETFEM